MPTSCSGCGCGNGSSSVASTTVKSRWSLRCLKQCVSTAIAVKPGDFRNMRTPEAEIFARGIFKHKMSWILFWGRDLVRIRRAYSSAVAHAGHCTGSMRVARRAGRKQATSATAIKTIKAGAKCDRIARAHFIKQVGHQARQQRTPRRRRSRLRRWLIANRVT